jgi:multidrug efflux pump subunit AcrB
MQNLIRYFATRQLLSNVLFVAILFMGLFTWFKISKEEMPEFQSNWIRVSTTYPGAPAEDVELFITKPMEDELKGVVGIEELVTTSSMGSSQLRITLDDDYPFKDDVVQDIEDAILRVKLPSEVRDLPRIRQFKSSEKAILDIGLYHKKQKILDTNIRHELQQFVLNFENQLLSKNEVSSIERRHYLKPEIQIIVDPKKLLSKELSLSTIKSKIEQNHIRMPVGSLLDKGESKVTALHELETPESFNKLVLQGNYSGKGIYLKDMATIENGHARSTSIFKVNGHEAIFLNIKKSVSTDILTAQKVVFEFIHKLQKQHPNIGIVPMDDESYAVRNRLKIISSNGILGFILIVIVLLLFLNFKAGFWVAMGIPFSMAFTLICAYMVGYTVNNMTLAGIIIVLGIVVDDAIIISENIMRHKSEGKQWITAAIDGTSEVFRPILASIITTCVAFVPLLYFEGFFGKLVTFIPLVVILMLLGSLIESLFILPSHMANKTAFIDSFSNKHDHQHWFDKYEKKYQDFLLKIFKKRNMITGVFLIILAGATFLFYSQMKFVMFPREESSEVFVKIKAPKQSTREETSKLIYPLEEFISQDSEHVVGVRSSIALSRRGGTVKENEASILIEVTPAENRDIPLNKLIKKWEDYANNLKGLESIKFLKGRWGHSSGSAIEIQIQENNDQIREKLADSLSTQLKGFTELKDVEIEEAIKKKEYLLFLKQDKLIRYNVDPASITATLRAFVEGSVLYSINKGDEEVDVRLSVPRSAKVNLQDLLELRVENREGQLTFLKKVVEIQEKIRPINITRNNFKRTTMIYANLNEKENATPMEIAEKIEQTIFPNLNNEFPSSILSFKGEIEDTREGQGEFKSSIIMVIILIYLILTIMFNSISRPFIILAIIPFGLAGVIFALALHGMSVYGFFAAIGALGMIGVVVNDAIVMIDKIDKKVLDSDDHPWETISWVASTRLRPVILTTLTTVAGVLPTAYGIAGYDSMLAEMMLAMGWGLAFGTVITLILIPVICSYTFGHQKA